MAALALRNGTEARCVQNSGRVLLQDAVERLLIGRV